jgi:hypothetical protein
MRWLERKGSNLRSPDPAFGPATQNEPADRTTSTSEPLHIPEHERFLMRHRLIVSATAGLSFSILVAGTVAAGIPIFQVTVTKTDAPDPVVAGSP